MTLAWLVLRAPPSVPWNRSIDSNLSATWGIAPGGGLWARRNESSEGLSSALTGNPVTSYTCSSLCHDARCACSLKSFDGQTLPETARPCSWPFCAMGSFCLTRSARRLLLTSVRIRRAVISECLGLTRVARHNTGNRASGLTVPTPFYNGVRQHDAAHYCIPPYFPCTPLES
jgi:hypothetical protein